RPFSDPKAAGAVSQRLLALGADALELRADEGEQFSLWLDGECLADSPAYAEPDELDAAMLRLRDAIDGLAG
ncbi:MAG: tryptophan--tRNA ligase, partial [Pseudomonas sp.]